MRRAANDWAATVFGAPSRFAELVTGIAACDEVLLRLATRVVRRDLREQRGHVGDRAAGRANQLSRRLTNDELDPFAYTADSLREATEHVADCTSCSGTGNTLCAECKGTGRARCPRCYGSGKQRSEKTGKPINCKQCRTSGTVICTDCNHGRVICRTCVGSGRELVWMAFEETSRWQVSVSSDGVVAQAHPALRTPRALEVSECAGLTIARNLETQGGLTPPQLAALPAQARPFIEANSRVHPRIERIAFQQVLELGVVRRDLSFEMCGGRGTLVLSGEQLAGSRTDEAMRPIRRRLWIWGALLLLLGFVSSAMWAGAFGKSAYYDGVRPWGTVLWLGSFAAAIPPIGGFLRRWRGGLRRWPPRRLERLSAAVSVIAWLAMVVLGVATLPTSAELQQALQRNDAARARVILAALVERSQESAAELADLEDAVLLVEAGKAAGPGRLSVLGKVADRGGPRAARAKEELTLSRIAEVRRLTAAGEGGPALAQARQWFPLEADRSPAILEAMAEAADAAARACPHTPCRLAVQRAALQYVATPWRQAGLEQTRLQLLASLTLPKAAAPPAQLLERLVALRTLRELAEETIQVLLPEDELVKQAELVRTGVIALRAAVPLLGASRLVVGELLGGLQGRQQEDIEAAHLGELEVLVSFDKKGLCRGLYLPRRKGGSAVSQVIAKQLLSQAVGKNVELRVPAGGRLTLASWAVGSVNVAVRGQLDEIVELRIGAANP